VVHRAIVLISSVCCILVLLSFALFAVKQISGASAHQVTSINTAPAFNANGTPVASTTAPPVQTKPVGQPKRFIDGAAKVLTSPFSSIVQSDNQWVTRGLPTVFALLVYGLGLGYLARFTRGMT
jgi:hypothetical protein